MKLNILPNSYEDLKSREEEKERKKERKEGRKKDILRVVIIQIIKAEQNILLL